MSVAQQIILSPQTASGTSAQVALSQNQLPATFVVGGLAGAETATLQIQDASGNWQTASFATAMTSTVQTTTVNAPGLYRVSKSATVATVGVALYSI